MCGINWRHALNRSVQYIWIRIETTWANECLCTKMYERVNKTTPARSTYRHTDIDTDTDTHREYESTLPLLWLLVLRYTQVITVVWSSLHSVRFVRWTSKHVYACPCAQVRFQLTISMLYVGCSWLGSASRENLSNTVFKVWTRKGSTVLFFDHKRSVFEKIIKESTVNWSCVGYRFVFKCVVRDPTLKFKEVCAFHWCRFEISLPSMHW